MVCFSLLKIKIKHFIGTIIFFKLCFACLVFNFHFFFFYLACRLKNESVAFGTQGLRQCITVRTQTRSILNNNSSNNHSAWWRCHYREHPRRIIREGTVRNRNLRTKKPPWKLLLPVTTTKISKKDSKGGATPATHTTKFRRWNRKGLCSDNFFY